MKVKCFSKFCRCYESESDFATFVIVMKVKVTSTVQQVANRISPGISRLRGVILYELQVLNDDDEVMITISREDEMMIITSGILKVN